MAHRFHMVEDFDILPRMERIRVPTLLMAGDRDLLVSERSLKSLCQGVPQARLLRLAGCGHLAFVTHPQRVADETKGFLSEDRL